MPDLIVQNHTFDVVECGEKEPSVLLIHSTGLGARQWKSLTQRLSPRRCFAPNLLGYSPSDSWKGREPIDWEIDFVACRQLLLQLPPPVDLVGHSYGGFIAMRLALEHPEHVRRIALHEPTAWGCLFDSGDEALQAAMTAIMEKLVNPGPSATPEQWLEMFVDFWNAPGVWAAMPKARQAVWIHLFPKVFAEVRQLCMDRTPLSVWQAVCHPTLITMGRASPPGEQEVCRLLADQLPRCTLVETNGGHLAPLTHPASVLPNMQKWLLDTLSPTDHPKV